jgi:hypothetical protein
MEQRLTALERSVSRWRLLAIIGLILGTAATGVASLAWRSATDRQSLPLSQLVLRGPNGNDVIMSVEDFPGAPTARLHFRGRSAEIGELELALSPSVSSLTVKPAGYGPHPQSWAQLSSSKDNASVEAYSGWTSSSLNVHHREFGVASVELRSARWSGPVARQEDPRVNAALRIEEGGVRLGGDQANSPYTVFERKR